MAELYLEAAHTVAIIRSSPRCAQISSEEIETYIRSRIFSPFTCLQKSRKLFYEFQLL
jgi:hypothetical protein